MIADKKEIINMFSKELGLSRNDIYSKFGTPPNEVAIVIDSSDFILSFDNLETLKKQIGFDELNIENEAERVYHSCHDSSSVTFRMWVRQ